VALYQESEYGTQEYDSAGSLRAGRIPEHQMLHSHTGVRRLTPTECERLQGFPDDWTLVEGTSDTARYRQLGNAVCVPVAEWIMRRIVAVEEDINDLF
jgi:site-specific DNA-cytosine methylase